MIPGSEVRVMLMQAVMSSVTHMVQCAKVYFTFSKNNKMEIRVMYAFGQWLQRGSMKCKVEGSRFQLISS